jgi:4-hydroxy-3-polyprenylbenzoate decarboxylase
MKRIVVGISGASGVVYGVCLLKVLAAVDDGETHFAMTPAAGRALILETDHSMEHVESFADVTHKYSDIAARISSGSFGSAGMIVARCSLKTGSGITTSLSDNLLLPEEGVDWSCLCERHYASWAPTASRAGC